MNCHRNLPLHLFQGCFTLIVFMLISACDNQTMPTQPSANPGEKMTFTGTWSATGKLQMMPLESKHSQHKAAIFQLTGSMLLEGKQRLKRGFKADLIGFSDNKSGMLGRSVWTDERGEKIFSALEGKAMVPDHLITGTFLGGTGRYANITGEYSFRWKRLVNNEHNGVSGRVVDLEGWAQHGAQNSPSSATGGLQ